MSAEKSTKLDGALLAVAVIFGVFGALVIGFMIYIIHRVKHRHLYMQVIIIANLTKSISNLELSFENTVLSNLKYFQCFYNE